MPVRQTRPATGAPAMVEVSDRVGAVRGGVGAIAADAGMAVAQSPMRSKRRPTRSHTAWAGASTVIWRVSMDMGTGSGARSRGSIPQQGIVAGRAGCDTVDHDGCGGRDSGPVRGPATAGARATGGRATAPRRVGADALPAPLLF